MDAIAVASYPVLRLASLEVACNCKKKKVQYVNFPWTFLYVILLGPNNNFKEVQHIEILSNTVCLVDDVYELRGSISALQFVILMEARRQLYR